MDDEKLPRNFESHMGEWIYLPRRKKWVLACCDCQLVHDVERKVVSGRLYVRLHRNGVETTLLRKAMRKRNGR